MHSTNWNRYVWSSYALLGSDSMALREREIPGDSGKMSGFQRWRKKMRRSQSTEDLQGCQALWCGVTMVCASHYLSWLLFYCYNNILQPWWRLKKAFNLGFTIWELESMRPEQQKLQSLCSQAQGWEASLETGWELVACKTISSDIPFPKVLHPGILPEQFHQLGPRV